MTELLTAAQMRAIEKAAIDSGEVTGLELMERAGRGVVEAVFEEWPDLAAAPHRAVVLCGPGNNGGDGFVVARLLKEWGWDVEVFLYGEPDELPPDAGVNYLRWNGNVKLIPKETIGHDPWECNLIVDAFFGTGLTRGLSWDASLSTNLPEWDLRAETGCPHVVAVDMPSGLCSDSGRFLEGDGLWADLTVTFHSAKLGHFIAEGPHDCGKVVCIDIGLPKRDYIQDAMMQTRNSKGPVGGTLFSPKILGKPDGIGSVEKIDMPRTGMLCKADFFGRAKHKHSYGHALIVAGGPGKGGAGRLAARGALRIGAGLVTLGCPPAALPENAAQLNAIMLKPLGSDEDLSLLLKGDARINALCLGPGLGTGARERQLVAAVLAASDGKAGGPGSGPGRRGVVLDADALTLVAGDAALFSALHENCVLTPHAGEFARLFPDIAEELKAPAKKGPAYSKVDATREAAKRAGCTVLFKGPDTVIADPSGRCAVNSAHYDRAAHWLATAGSGDVLAGFLTGLLARGFEMQQAAETAAWLHVECALNFGPGLIAEDLPEMLPQVFRDLGI